MLPHDGTAGCNWRAEPGGTIVLPCCQHRIIIAGFPIPVQRSGCTLDRHKPTAWRPCRMISFAVPHFSLGICPDHHFVLPDDQLRLASACIDPPRRAKAGVS